MIGPLEVRGNDRVPDVAEELLQLRGGTAMPSPFAPTGEAVTPRKGVEARLPSTDRVDTMKRRGVPPRSSIDAPPARRACARPDSDALSRNSLLAGENVGAAQARWLSGGLR